VKSGFFANNRIVSGSPSQYQAEAQGLSLSQSIGGHDAAQYVVDRCSAHTSLPEQHHKSGNGSQVLFLGLVLSSWEKIVPEIHFQECSILNIQFLPFLN